jgi:hypothetical protein
MTEEKKEKKKKWMKQINMLLCKRQARWLSVLN